MISQVSHTSRNTSAIKLNQPSFQQPRFGNSEAEKPHQDPEPKSIVQIPLEEYQGLQREVEHYKNLKESYLGQYNEARRELREVKPLANRWGAKVKDRWAIPTLLAAAWGTWNIVTGGLGAIHQAIWKPVTDAEAADAVVRVMDPKTQEWKDVALMNDRDKEVYSVGFAGNKGMYPIGEVEGSLTPWVTDGQSAFLDSERLPEGAAREIARGEGVEGDETKGRIVYYYNRDPKQGCRPTNDLDNMERTGQTRYLAQVGAELVQSGEENGRVIYNVQTVGEKPATLFQVAVKRDSYLNIEETAAFAAIAGAHTGRLTQDRNDCGLFSRIGEGKDALITTLPIQRLSTPKGFVPYGIVSPSAYSGEEVQKALEEVSLEANWDFIPAETRQAYIQDLLEKRQETLKSAQEDLADNQREIAEAQSQTIPQTNRELAELQRLLEQNKTGIAPFPSELVKEEE